MNIGPQVKCPLVFLYFNETCIFLQIAEKYSNIKFHGNPSGGSQIVSRGQTDIRRDMRKLIVAFRNVMK
jgi:hypothetical protein